MRILDKLFDTVIENYGDQLVFGGLSFEGDNVIFILDPTENGGVTVMSIEPESATILRKVEVESEQELLDEIGRVLLEYNR